MQTFHTRQQLISWLEDNAPDRVISTALQQGEVELLGGFHPVAGSSYPGFIVRIHQFSPYVYSGELCPVYDDVGIVIDNQHHKIRSFRIRKPNWKNWIGWKSNNVLYMGDNYEANVDKYERAKNESN